MTMDRSSSHESVDKLQTSKSNADVLGGGNRQGGAQRDVAQTIRPQKPNLQVPHDSSASAASSQPPNNSFRKDHMASEKEVKLVGEPSKNYPSFTQFLPNLQWIPANFNGPHLKPVIRCAISTWISLVLLVIPRVEQVMGQSSFLIVIASILSPPCDPFVAVMERELMTLLLVTTSYGWSCLGIKLSSLARRDFVLTANIDDIVSGQYIEAAPAIICAIFLFIGSAFLLFIKAKKGAGPFAVACVLGCICLDVSLTIAPLYPYAFYTIGQVIVIPVSFHSAVALICSVLIFPETVNARFAKCLRAVFDPLRKAMEQQPELLSHSPTMSSFDPKPFFKLVATSESALTPLAASARLIDRDISWGRFSATDLSRFHDSARRLSARADGMAFYFKIIDPMREKFPGTPTTSRPDSPIDTPNLSRQSSLMTREEPASTTIGSITPRHRRPEQKHHHQHHHHQHHHSLSHHHHGHYLSLLQDALNRSQEQAVGVFESQKYLNLETQIMHHPDADALVEESMRLLAKSSTELLRGSANALKHIVAWLDRLNTDRFWELHGLERVKTWEKAIQDNEEAKIELERAVSRFRNRGRLLVLDPYRSAFVLKGDRSSPSDEPPPHRYLFQSYLYQYHLMRFARDLCEVLDEINRLERTRQRSCLWLPLSPLSKIFTWNKWDVFQSIDHNDEEDPDIIPGINPHTEELSMAKHRDPDALPPGNVFEVIGSMLYYFMAGLGGGNVIFGLKAGLLTVLLGLPFFLPHSARFAYENRFLWAIFMGQLTLGRFRGDTVSVLVSRVISTFLGGVVGMVMWYISTGNGRGNSFGLAAVSAVCFPPFFFAQLYMPGPPLTILLFSVTSQLVVGFSWQDSHFPTLASPGLGFEVAWKRFVLVSAGVTIAFIFSFLPPSTTLRRYIRTTYATTTAEIGQLYCEVVSYANTHNKPLESQVMVKSLSAIRSKLKRSTMQRTNVIYEFSLRGKWPMERYDKLLEIQMEISYLLSHLRSVIENLEPAWARAFLHRTRFLESDFQGDVLAVISMISTALRTGTPLPQITPCPLLDRFVVHRQGFSILRHGAEEDYGLPRTLTIETLENEQYLCFSVGICTAYGIVTRLDRLMLATKELVGEQYHIHGLRTKATNRELHQRGHSVRFSQV